jgi:hypothetical protein
MAKPLEHAGVQYTNADAWRTAKATKAAPKPAEGVGKPLHTEHHPDGTHTTVHEDGTEHNHENLEALKAHLDQFLSEEGHEGGEEHDDWDEEK